MLTEGRTPHSGASSFSATAPSPSSVTWNPPGAIRTVPASMREPGAASCTDSGESSSSRCASERVNPRGMCCTITTGTPRSAGSDVSTWRKA